MNRACLSLAYLLIAMFLIGCSDMKALTTDKDSNDNNRNMEKPFSKFEDIVMERDSLTELIVIETKKRSDTINLNEAILSLGLKHISNSSNNKSNYANGHIATTDIESNTFGYSDEISYIDTNRRNRFGFRSRTNLLDCFILEDQNKQRYVIMNLKHIYMGILNELAIKIPFVSQDYNIEYIDDSATILTYKNTNYLDQTRLIKQSSSDLNAVINIKIKFLDLVSSELDIFDFVTKPEKNHRFIHTNIKSDDYSQISGTSILVKAFLDVGCYVDLNRYISLNSVSSQ